MWPERLNCVVCDGRSVGWCFLYCGMMITELAVYIELCAVWWVTVADRLFSDDIYCCWKIYMWSDYQQFLFLNIFKRGIFTQKYYLIFLYETIYFLFLCIFVLRPCSYIYLCLLSVRYFVPVEFLFVLDYIGVFYVVYCVYLSQYTV